MHASRGTLAQLVIVLLLVPFACATKPWTPGTYPNPQKDVQACGRRGVPSFVCDPDGVLTYSGANVVEGVIKEILEGHAPYALAECGSEGKAGFQVAVAVMKRFEKDDYKHKTQAADAFAKQLLDNWGVGRAGCNNGVLLLLSVGDRQVHIATGAATLGLLTDDVLDTIIDNMKPALRDERYDDAVAQAVHEVGLALSGQAPPHHAGGDDNMDGWAIFGFFALVVSSVLGWGWISSRRQKKRYQTCQDKLSAIKRDQAAIRRNQYASKTCPICLDEFTPEPQSKDNDKSLLTASIEQDAGSPSKDPSLKEERTALLGGKSTPADIEVNGGSEGEVGTSRASSSSSKREKRPLVLRCGHSFCEPCIQQWLKTKSSCPVCRKDITDDPDEPSNASTNQRSIPPDPCSDQLQRDNEWRQQLWMTELGFRLRQLRRMYPDYITDPMLLQWEEDVRHQRDLDTHVVQQFEARNPAHRQQLEQSGRQGISSQSFGGGSSWGGGGRGGSW